MDKVQADYMKDLVSDIFEEMDELAANKKEKENWWQTLAYATVLGRIKSYIDEDGWKDFGLDIDIDKKYL